MREIGKMIVISVSTVSAGAGLAALFVILTDGTNSLAQFGTVYVVILGVTLSCVGLVALGEIVKRISAWVPANLRQRFAKEIAPGLAVLAMVFIAPEAFRHDGGFTALSRIVTGLCACVGAYTVVDWFLNGSWRNADPDHSG